MYVWESILKWNLYFCPIGVSNRGFHYRYTIHHPLPPLAGWSKEQLLEAWMEDPTEACEKAGVQLPANLGTHNLDTPTSVLSPPGPPGEGDGERECGVCVVSFTPDIEVPCGHVFCRDCWKTYLHQKIGARPLYCVSRVRLLQTSPYCEWLYIAQCVCMGKYSEVEPLWGLGSE